MAVPSYETDLTTIDTGTYDWGELTGAIAGAASGTETDYFIEGTQCVAKPFNATGLGSMACTKGSGAITLSTGAASFHWIYYGSPNAIDTLANGGYRIAIGSGIAAYKMWYVLGQDTYTYGGWQNIVIDPTVAYSVTYGSPTSALLYFGSVVNSTAAVSKGVPYGNDVIRFGRDLIVTAGQTGNSATFAGAATTNDSISNRWGQFQAISGGYLQKGKFVMGTSATAVDFADTNRNIFIQDTTKVNAGFNEFEVNNTASSITWSGINISALGTTSKGKFTTIDNAPILIDTCTFTDMDTFVFQSNAQILNTTFRRCGIVTQGSATFTTCKFDNPSGSKAIIVNDVSIITDTEFISDGTGYAMEGFSSPDSYNLTDLTFTSYAVADGTSGNEAIHVLATAGSVNFLISGGNTPTIHTEGATVSFPSSITLSMTVKNTSNVTISAACAYIDETDVAPFIMNVTTNANGVATVSYTGGAVANSIWRIRKYGYKDFKQLVDIETSNISLPITLITDPQQT